MALMGRRSSSSSLAITDALTCRSGIGLPQKWEGMCVPNPKEPVRTGPPTKFAETTPPQLYPSGDYSYVLEIVMAMQNTVGGLKEAVESLKQQSGKHSEKLDDIGKDIHAAKT